LSHGDPDMRYGRIGGMLVMGGVVLFVVGYALMILGAAAGNLVTGTAIALIGSGAAILCVTGPTPLHGGVIRVGLGALAVGFASLLASSIVASTLTYDPLENGPFVILGIVGFLGIALGSLFTAVSLLREPGPSRVVGSLLVAGPMLFLLAGTLSPHVADVPLLSVVAGEFVILGAIGFVLGGAGIGMLVIRGDRPAPTGAT
jgi:hypothetical protein